MKPIDSGGHAAYRNFLQENFLKFYPNPQNISESTWQVIEKFWNLDLSEVNSQMSDLYSKCGPKPRLPSDMLRSLLVSVEFKIDSYTKWSYQLKINPLFALLSGFLPGDTPGIGTFADFIKRLWMSPFANINNRVHPPKIKINKPERVGEKAGNEQKTTVYQLIKQYEDNPYDTNQPYSRLFQLFNTNFLKKSCDLGLIDMNNLTISGDGTPIVTSARERFRRICDCESKGIRECTCPREYTQPDCDVGWDSSREHYYHGYDLYLLTCANSSNDLPIFPLLNPASMHDSLGLTHTWFAMKSFLPELNVEKVLLDAAHDAMAFYSYFQKTKVKAFIDLNKGCALNKESPFRADIVPDKDGIPICPAGIRMKSDGRDIARGRIKYRCPMRSKKFGVTCPNPCTNAKHGRVEYISSGQDIRFFTSPARGTKEWNDEYKARTSSERCNKRIKKDYVYENGRYQSSRNWYCRLYCIMMCQHLDAWDISNKPKLKDLLAG